MNFEKLKAALGAKKPGATPQTEPTAATADAAVLSAEQETTLTTALAEAKAEGIKEGTTASAKAANDRIAAILGSDKVKGKTDAALSLAISVPDLSAEKVIEIVAALPAGSTAATIEQRMRGQGTALALGQPMQAPQATASGWDKAIAKLPGAQRQASN